ncbi:helix-turn-helix transcriptional regulator [Puia sp. P3]|jgi:putative transcriptional regulator|uniref:helix-turn-helix transcriptional regulator n=1 Tax=Puia sp. P3 TaxID=3423952 RepID=UPI003D66C463
MLDGNNLNYPAPQTAGEKMEKKLKINRIKAVLAEKDISHKELATRVGIAPNSVTRICNNEFQPTLKLLREIALALDVDIRELLIPTRTF